MDNVLTDMVQRLRAIELLLRTQNELLGELLAERKRATASSENGNAMRESVAHEGTGAGGRHSDC